MPCYDSNITHKKQKSLNYFISLVLIPSSCTYWIVFWGNASHTERVFCIQMAGANMANTYLWSLIFLHWQAIISLCIINWCEHMIQVWLSTCSTTTSVNTKQQFTVLEPSYSISSTFLGYNIKWLKPWQFLLYHSYSHTICLNWELNYYKNTHRVSTVNNSGFNSQLGARYFYLLKNIQTNSGVHSASYWMGIEVLSNTTWFWKIHSLWYPSI